MIFGSAEVLLLQRQLALRLQRISALTFYRGNTSTTLISLIPTLITTTLQPMHQ